MLNHPDADTGQEKPSLLEWRKRTDLQLDHVVLGKGRPGGCWDSLDGGVQVWDSLIFILTERTAHCSSYFIECVCY